MIERTHNPMLVIADTDAFAAAPIAGMPSRPDGQERIVAANRAGTPPARA